MHPKLAHIATCQNVHNLWWRFFNLSSMNLNCSAIALSVPPTFLNRAVLRATRNRSLNRVLGLASSSSGNFALYEWRIVRLKSTPAALIGYVNGLEVEHRLVPGRRLYRGSPVSPPGACRAT